METITMTIGQLDAVHQRLKSERLAFLEALPEAAADALLRWQTERHARSSPSTARASEAAKRRTRQAVTGDQVGRAARATARDDGR